MFTPTTTKTKEFRTRLLSLIEEHGPISADGLAKLCGKNKKAYQIRNSIQAMRLDGYPVSTVDGLVCVGSRYN